jgi:DeoR family transcriptional regulator, aga operon transcriptional repressor
MLSGHSTSEDVRMWALPGYFYTPCMRRSTRLSTILERVASGESVAVDELAEQLQVSPGTIRRDLAMLAQQRLLSRTHGGAVAHSVSYELPLRYKSARHSEEKRRIARAAADRVAEGMSVGLTGGTTTTAVADVLAGAQGLTIVTNALNIASDLAIRPNLKLLVTGGHVRSNSYELSGPAAEATLAPLNLDLAFVGVDGIEAQAGCTTYEEVEAHTNSVMVEHARHVLVVADSSKVGKVAFARICLAATIDELITDDAADPDAVDALTDAGIKVTFA